MDCQNPLLDIVIVFEEHPTAIYTMQSVLFALTVALGLSAQTTAQSQSGASLQCCSQATTACDPGTGNLLGVLDIATKDVTGPVGLSWKFPCPLMVIV